MGNKNKKILLLSTLGVLALTSCGQGGGGDTSEAKTSSDFSTSISLESTDASSESSSSSSQVDPDVEAANEVIAIINQLSDSSTEAEVRAARQAYDDLTNRQKAIVDNSGATAKLEEFESKITFKTAVKNVLDLIDALDDEDPDEDAVKAARNAYDELIEEYIDAARSEIPASYIEKLEAAEKVAGTKVIATWLAKAITLDLGKTADIAQFALLSKDIDAVYAELSQDKKDALVDYASYDAKKTELGDFAAVVHEGYDIVNKEFEATPSLSDEDYGHIYKADLANVALQGAGNLQFYISPMALEGYDRLGLFVNMPFDAVVKLFNNDSVAAEVNVVAENWSFLQIDVTRMSKPKDYCILATYFDDLSLAARNGYKMTSIVGYKATSPEGMDAVPGVWFNSEMTGWNPYNDTVEDFENGVMTVCDFSVATRDFQFCWNNIPKLAMDNYVGFVEKIYNPTSETFEGIPFTAITSSWVNLASTMLTLAPGWNTIEIPASFFSTKPAMFTMTVRLGMAAEGWKFGKIFAQKVTDDVDFGDINVISNVTNYAPLERSHDETYGSIVTANYASAGELGVISTIWDNVPKQKVGAYKSVYLWIYNPTESTITDVTFKSNTSSWVELVSCNGGDLLPGWNKVVIRADLFTDPNLYYVTIDVVGEAKAAWVADGWKFGNFHGLA